jgi:hypothetical protein
VYIIKAVAPFKTLRMGIEYSIVTKRYDLVTPSYKGEVLFLGID